MFMLFIKRSAISLRVPHKKRLMLAGFFACLCIFPQFSIGNTSTIVISETIPASIPAEIIADWKAKDNPGVSYSEAISKIKEGLPEEYRSKIIDNASEEGYIKACHWRRVFRIKPYSEKLWKILYARHHDIGGSIIGYTEELKDDIYTSGLGKFGDRVSVSGGNYWPGGALLILTMDNYYPAPVVLLEDKSGCIRDPCVSFDAKKVVFAWSKDKNGYHICEMKTAIPADIPVQLTFDPVGLNVSDFEPCYLPNGDILFNSSRCFQHVDCNFNIVSNLYLMNKDGHYLRRVGYDQVHTFYPSIMNDGTVLYSRWEYNDRNIANCFGLFQMNIDGTHQTEYFGNQTSWPATIPQGREIPNGKGKILAITGGHVGPYAGDLIIIDKNLNRNGSEAVQLIAPKRLNPPTCNIDIMSGVPAENKLFQSPYPLDENWFLISYRPPKKDKFNIYLMNIDGERELLAWDSSQSVSQQQSCIARKSPPRLLCRTDYSKNTAEITMTNAYIGTGTEERVAKGSIKKLRVISLTYHTDPSFGNTGSSLFTMTPIARYLGSWEAKRIVGEAKVERDGSAAFIVPARTPIYFQLIDSNGCAINSMRSWVTLMPKERFDCYGCHEDKNLTPPPLAELPLAMQPQELDSFYGMRNEYFYYPKQIQPILDEKCVSCHKPGGSGEKLDLRGDRIWTGDLTDDPDNVNAGRRWCRSYYNLTNNLTKPESSYVNFITVNSSATGLLPNDVGSVKSRLIAILRDQPAGMKPSGMTVTVTKKEMAKICAWIDLCIPHSGFYTDDMPSIDSTRYLERMQRRIQVETEETANIKNFIEDGGYESPDYKNNDPLLGMEIEQRQNDHAVLGAFKIILSGQKIFIESPCEGNLAVHDMLGRTVLNYFIRNEAAGNNQSTAARLRLSRGIYIATLKTKTATISRIINVIN